MTKDEFKEVAMKISEITSDKEEVMDLLKQLQTGFEDAVKDPPSPPAPQDEWKKSYDDLLKRYRERFFSSEPDKPEDPLPSPPLPEPEPEQYTYDKILKEV